jgi:uncharacterized SAM-dependent methyltransferase
MPAAFADRREPALSASSHTKRSATGDSPILVAVRLRPHNDRELAAKADPCVRVTDSKTVSILREEGLNQYLSSQKSSIKDYEFDIAFDARASQEEVYLRTTQVSTGIRLEPLYFCSSRSCCLCLEP